MNDNTLLSILFICLTLIFTALIMEDTITEINRPLHYTYRDFSETDIELAMRYHGTKSCIIKEGEQPFFMEKDGREIILFTDSAIEYLMEQKKGGLK